MGGGRFEVHELASESHIEERVRQAFGFLTARQQASEGTVRERARRNQENDDAFYREAASLSRELLGPVTDIDRFSRLVVVSDGALNYFPIGVLAHPERSGPDAKSYVPLLSTHEVVRAPSVTSMLALQAGVAPGAQDRASQSSPIRFSHSRILESWQARATRQLHATRRNRPWISIYAEAAARSPR